MPRETAFATLAEEAEASPPGAKGLLLLPYFSGERTPIHDPKAKGAFFGLNLTHTRGDMYRAMLEGIANGTAHVIETYRDVGHAPARVLAVGGGTKNKVWIQATSDIGGVPQIVCEKTIGASYGDAFLAAVAVGAVKPGDIARLEPGGPNHRARDPRRLRPAISAVQGALPADPRHRRQAGGRVMLARARTALDELGGVIGTIDPAAVEQACETIAAAGRIVLYGCGREGLQMRGLRHAAPPPRPGGGVQGEMTAPPVGPGDLFIASAGRANSRP